MKARAMPLILLSIMILSLLSGPTMAASPEEIESSRYKCATFLKEEIRNAMIRDIEEQGLAFEASRRSPDRVEVGDTRIFWDWDLSAMPPGNRLVDATCRGIGDYAYIFVADDQWGGNVEETDIGLLLDAFENVTPIGSIDPDQGIYENDTDLFGDVPDALDGDSKIYILLLDIPGYGGYEFDGYFNAFDQYPDDFTWGTYGEHSNEVEMLYVNSEIRPVTADATLSVVAHELEHMIHWNYDTDESSWVDESMAEAAMTVNGYYTDQAWVADFMSNPNIQLTQSTYVHYGACLLWGTYLYEQFGDLDILKNGDRLWRLHIRAEGASSLNFGFNRYRMPAGGELFIYGPDGSSLRGPFTDRDNEAHGQLWTPVVIGGEAVIELAIPAIMVPYLELELSSINYGYKEFWLQGGDKSGSCNVDVVCSDGDDWQAEIRSVAVISTGGGLFCSGFLVNSTADDLTPYFMTASHCGITSSKAPSLVVYWNYESSTCGGAPDGQLDQYQSGSIFRASGSASDFTLVELDDDPDPAFDVYWSGWDRSDADPQQAVAIHHPRTDEKRISFEYDPLSTASYLGTSAPGDGTHIRVADWDVGTTEPGSSGSGLWNADHRIVGQLHGGYAACGNNLADWYGRFSVSWNSGGSPSSRLKDWLDPGGTELLVLDGRESCVRPMVDFEAEPNPAAAGEEVFFTSTISGGMLPYTYAWDVDGDGVTDYTVANPTHIYAGSYDGPVQLTVSDSELCDGSVSHHMAAIDTECADDDGDGYGDPANPLCLYPDRDCDDGDPAVHPGASEIRWNGIDENCDGNDCFVAAVL
ncbi:MopE-related protein [Thermodesulfobacteriota bacterium]